MRKIIFKIDDQEYLEENWKRKIVQENKQRIFSKALEFLKQFIHFMEMESKSTGTNLQIIRETKSISMI